MKVTKKQIKRIVEAHTGVTLSEIADDHRDEIATQIRNASKDIYGRKDVYDLEGKSVEELEDILHDLSNSPEQRAMDDMERDEMESSMGRDGDLSRAEMAPKSQGMGRRPAGSKGQRRMENRVIKITKRQLRRIIREEKAKLQKKQLKESVADMQEYESMIEEASMGLAEIFMRDMEALYEEEPGQFSQSPEEWGEEVYAAGGELQQQISSVINQAIESVEADLIGGQYGGS